MDACRAFSLDRLGRYSSPRLGCTSRQSPLTAITRAPVARTPASIRSSVEATNSEPFPRTSSRVSKPETGIETRGWQVFPMQTGGDELSRAPKAPSAPSVSAASRLGGARTNRGTARSGRAGLGFGPVQARSRIAVARFMQPFCISPTRGRGNGPHAPGVFEAAHRCPGMVVDGRLRRFPHTLGAHLALEGAPANTTREIMGDTDITTTVRSGCWERIRERLPWPTSPTIPA
jgi:hypothetical protein